MKLEALDHPKTLDLAARLNVELPTAIGHLELLWAFTAKKAPQGNIGKWPDGAIARACYWNGDPSVFVCAVAAAGFIDPHAAHRYIIHDWKDHAPRWVLSKLSRANLLIFDSSADSSADCSGECSGDSSSHSVREGKPSLAKGRVNTAGVEPDGSPPVITLTTNRGDEFPIHESHCEEWGTLFPAVDVRQELRNMRAWLLANPRQRKTASGMLRFATSWLSRAQNSSGGTHAARQRVDNSAPARVRRANERQREQERGVPIDGEAKRV